LNALKVFHDFGKAEPPSVFNPKDVPIFRIIGTTGYAVDQEAGQGEQEEKELHGDISSGGK
jgi:hypothetical protein